MEKLRQKAKREKPIKLGEKEKSQSFIDDVKSIKEHLKIKELLRTVKMNSSMRVKAPKGSKVMNNKDFNENEDFFDEISIGFQENELSEPASAINADVVLVTNDIYKKTAKENLIESIDQSKHEDICNKLDEDFTKKSSEISRTVSSVTINHQDLTSEDKLLNDKTVKYNERKLSLDHTILTRRESLSQSEFDLHSVGKSPLERKSSFFRKRMDSFLKNTTEIFKRQLLSSKPLSPRRGSLSVSLQSLHGNAEERCSSKCQESLCGSVSSLGSGASGPAGIGIAAGAGDDGSFKLAVPAPVPDDHDHDHDHVNSQQRLSASQPLSELSSDSVLSLNEAYRQELMLNSRAMSMSSGLDSANDGKCRRKTNRSNRVTWVGSEGVANYLKRVIQDEKKKDTQSHSYSDFLCIPENELCVSKLDSKGRRLSYQRAVSGESPRYYDTSLRKKTFIPESYEASYDISNQLAEYTRNGVPGLKGFCVANIPDVAFAYLLWAEKGQNIEDLYDWKKLPPNEESRQAVIRELVSTEADHIKHLMAIVEVFIATAHALQDSGKMLEVDTEKLFSNIPDVLNTSLYFWNLTFFPMLSDAVEKNTPFNTELMSQGFCRFREIFQPYEKYVHEQTKALDYLRSLSSNPEFMMYLTWCHSHKTCNRLQLSDIMVKPMQRLTKYSLILRRIIGYTDIEPERTSLIAMVSFAKNYVLDLNRSIRQREELEKLDALANSIDTYEIDFKDEDMDRYFRLYSGLNLKAPMVNSLPSHSRTIIHQGDLRYRDQHKEMDVRVFLLTDMMLICKKQSKGSSYPYKLIRPKFMIDKMVPFPKINPKSTKDSASLIFVIVDEVGSAYHAFTLTETSKDSTALATLKHWELKIREARLTYDLGVWFARNPSRDLSEVEMDSSSEYAVSTSGKQGIKQSSDDWNIEREARERVATMLHRSMGASTEHDYSQASMMTDSFDGEPSGASSLLRGSHHGHSLRHHLHRTSTGGSSRNSRLSSFQQSTSAASHDEPHPGPSRYDYRAGSSVEHHIPPLNPDDTVTSITVNVVSESESETVKPMPITPQQSAPPKLSSRSTSPGQHTLRVQPQSGIMALVHSLPDLTLDPSPTSRLPHSVSPQSASEKLYQSHQELLQRNRLSASQHHHQYLTPDHRGTSYPPPSPTRASLKRGLAFSYSIKNPPLSKMGHVHSTQVLSEAGPSSLPKISSDRISSMPGPSTSSDKTDKLDKKSDKPSKNSDKQDKKSEKQDKKSDKNQISSRHKGGNCNRAPSSARKDDKVD